VFAPDHVEALPTAKHPEHGCHIIEIEDENHQLRATVFPQASPREAVVSLVIAALGLSGGVVTIGLILFER
jgi:hypothetical protein